MSGANAKAKANAFLRRAKIMKINDFQHEMKKKCILTKRFCSFFEKNSAAT